MILLYFKEIKYKRSAKKSIYLQNDFSFSQIDKLPSDFNQLDDSSILIKCYGDTDLLTQVTVSYKVHLFADFIESVSNCIFSILPVIQLLLRLEYYGSKK